MIDPPPASPPARPTLSPGRLNFTALQFVLFAGAAVVGLAALLAAGLAFGLALAGAAVLAVLVLAIWLIAANLAGAGGRSGRRGNTP